MTQPDVEPGRRPMTTTTVTLTGTGVPHPSPGRAGPGVLVRHGATALQFDAGRGTVLRLTEAGVMAHELDAVFVTHMHSDHLVDLADLVMTRWVEGTLHPAGPLPIVAVEGDSTHFASVMLDPYAADIAVRAEHVLGRPPELDIRPVRVCRRHRSRSGGATTGRSPSTRSASTTNRSGKPSPIGSPRRTASS